jgi:hypothetical protein
VNPSNAPVTYALGASYYDISNTTGGAPGIVTSTTIQPQGAVFLLSSSVGSLACIVHTDPVVPALAAPPPPTDVLGDPVAPIVVLGANTVTFKQTLSFRNGALNPCSFDINDGPFQSNMALAASGVAGSSGGTVVAQAHGTVVLDAPSFDGVFLEAAPVHFHKARYIPVTRKSARYRPVISKEARFDP